MSMPNDARSDSTSSAYDKMDKRELPWLPTRNHSIPDLDIEINDLVSRVNDVYCGKPMLTRWNGELVREVNNDTCINSVEGKCEVEDEPAKLDEIDCVSRKVRIIQVKPMYEEGYGVGLSPLSAMCSPTCDNEEDNNDDKEEDNDDDHEEDNDDDHDDDDGDDDYMRYPCNDSTRGNHSLLSSETSRPSSSADDKSTDSSSSNSNGFQHHVEPATSSEDEECLPLHLRTGERGVMSAWHEKSSSEIDMDNIGGNDKSNIGPASVTTVTVCDSLEFDANDSLDDLRLHLHRRYPLVRLEAKKKSDGVKTSLGLPELCESDSNCYDSSSLSPLSSGWKSDEENTNKIDTEAKSGIELYNPQGSYESGRNQALHNSSRKPRELFSSHDFSPIFTTETTPSGMSGIRSIHSEVNDVMNNSGRDSSSQRDKQKKNVFKSMRSKFTKSKSFFISKM